MSESRVRSEKTSCLILKKKKNHFHSKENKTKKTDTKTRDLSGCWGGDGVEGTGGGRGGQRGAVPWPPRFCSAGPPQVSGVGAEPGGPGASAQTPTVTSRDPGVQRWPRAAARDPGMRAFSDAVRLETSFPRGASGSVALRGAVPGSGWWRRSGAAPRTACPRVLRASVSREREDVQGGRPGPARWLRGCGCPQGPERQRHGSEGVSLPAGGEAAFQEDPVAGAARTLPGSTVRSAWRFLRSCLRG